MINPDLSLLERTELFSYVTGIIESYISDIKELPATPKLDQKIIRDYINKTDLNNPPGNKEAVDHVIKGLEEFSVHTPHPKYFGLFNPRPVVPGILADFITAAFNPQMAAWSHSPFAAEVEARLIRELGQKFGYETDKADGEFCSGGAEANQTAILCALENSFPGYAREGLMHIGSSPVIYCSDEAHHSVNKAAKTSGLGYKSVHEIPSANDQCIDKVLLERRIKNDIESGQKPFMLIGTAGTTGTGAIDDLTELSRIAEKYNLWFHVDAAYGGAAILSKGLKNLLSGIEKSDSITFDAHKWMSVPMGASIFLTSKEEILSKTFSINTEYMPKDARGMEVTDPYSHSIQWSRRFIGLKLYLALLFFGWKGYEYIIDHQTNMGNELREKLKENNWSVKNSTKLPVVCFTDDNYLNNKEFPAFILDNTLKSGKSWISIYPVNDIACLRACITNYNTNEDDISALVNELNIYRDKFILK